MRFNKYHSSTDEGANTVLEALALQPETVLGFLFLSYPGERADARGVYSHLSEYAEQHKESLSKYQVGILFTHAYKDIFDTQATLFHYRYPYQYLAQLNALVPEVAVHHLSDNFLPDCVKGVTHFHSRTLEQDERWLTTYGRDESEGIREQCESVISHGYTNKEGADERRTLYWNIGKSALNSQANEMKEDLA